MEFGRVQNIDNIIFSLSADPVMTGKLLQSTGGGDVALRVYVGGTGWGQTKWLGKVYPRGTKAKPVIERWGAVRETWELLFELGIGAVITDTPGRQDFRRIDEWGTDWGAGLKGGCDRQAGEGMSSEKN